MIPITIVVVVIVL